MLHRAGKPEFFCLGRIAAPAHEICNRNRERFVQDVFPSNVACANWERGSPAEEVARVCQAYLENIFSHEGSETMLSYPLEHALRLLIEACSDETTASVLEQFMQDSIRTK
jgi:hypothetical protein